MDNQNPLLAQQLAGLKLDPEKLPKTAEKWQELLQTVTQTYNLFEEDTDLSAGGKIDLRQRNQVFNQAMELADIGVWSWDLQTRQITWSEQVPQILQVDPTDFDENLDDYMAIVHDEDKDHVSGEMQQAIRGTGHYAMKHRIQPHGADGRTLWIEAQGSVLRSPNGRAVQLVGTVQDITASHQAQLNIQTRLRYEHAVNQVARILSTQPIKKGGEEEAPTAKDAIDQALEEMRTAAGTSRAYIFENFLDEEAGLCVRQTHEVCAEGVEPQIDNPELQFIPFEAAGLQRWQETLSAGNYLADRVADSPPSEREILEPQGIKTFLALPIYIGADWYGLIGFDNTENEEMWKTEDIELLQTGAQLIGSYINRERTEELLEERVAERTNDLVRSEQRSQSLITSSPDPLVIYDEVGQVTYLNPIFTQVFGWTLDELQGDRIDFVPEHAEEETSNAIKTLFEAGRVDAFPTQRLTKDGKLLDVEVSAAALKKLDGSTAGMVVIIRNVSARRAAERELEQYREQLEELVAERTAELRQSEGTVSNLLSNLPGMAYQCDNDKNWTMRVISDGCYDLTGYRPEELIGTSGTVYADLIHPGDQDRIWDDVQAAIAEKKSYRFTYRLIDRDGEEKIVWEQGRGLFDEDGTLIGLEGFATDITEQEQATEALRVQETLLRLVINNIPGAVFWKDRDGRYLGANQTFTEDAGLDSPADLIGKTDYELGWGEEADFFSEIDRRVIENDAPQVGVMEKLTTADDETAWLETNKVPLHDGNGNIIGVLGTYQNITERVETQQRIEYQAGLLEQISDAIISHDLNFTIRTWNQAAEEMYGYQAEETIGRPLTDFLEPHFGDYHVKEIMEQMRETNEFTGRIVQTTKAGRELIVSASASMLHDSSGDPTGVVVVGRDITALERATEESRRLNRIIENTSDFVGILSPEGEFTFLNSAAYQLIDRAPDGEEALHLEDVLAGKEIPLIFDEALPTAVEKGLWAGETTLLARNGTERPVSQIIMAHRDPEGEVEYLTTVARDISASKRLEERNRQLLNRRSRQVEITTRIAQEIVDTEKLGDLYRKVVTLVKEEFNYYHVQLLQYSKALDEVSLVVGYGEIGDKMLEAGHTMELGSGLIGTAAATGRSVLRPNITQDPRWASNPLLPDTEGELAVPIKFGDEILGVLDVQSDTADQLTEEDQVMLEGLCGQIAIAIESTRLRSDMEERLTELNKLQRLMSREGWSNYQARRGGKSIGYMFDQTGVQKMGVDEEKGGAEPQVTDLTSAGNARLVTTPVEIRGQSIGMIGLQDSTENPMNAADKTLLESISNQVAEALENARLLEQTQKRAVELEAVARVSAATSTILEQEQLLKSVADLTKERFQLYHAHIYRLSADEKTLRLEAGAGQIGKLLVAENWNIALDHPNSIVAKVARQRSGHISSNVRQDEGYLPNPLLPATRSELAVPMVAGNTLWGVLDIQSDQENAFSEEDLRIYNTLATQVAIALQNATLYQEQRETAEQLREVDRLKSEFLASMSHELRTPLNSIIGFADVLLEGIDGELNDRMREDVTLIRDGGQHLRNLIGDILDMSKIEAGMMDLSYGIVDLRRVAKEVLATTKGLVTDKPVTVISNIDDNIDVIEADRTRLVQILLNLLSNAAKFTDEGSVILSMSRDDELLKVSVKDSGVGIKKEDIGQVFEQFRQIGGIENRKAGGTGLGMPITKQLVELHGGEIGLDSVYGRGTTFWFTIPYERPEEMPTPSAGYYA